MTTIKITNEDTGDIVYLTTKNKKIRESVYVWKKKNNIDYKFKYEVVDNLPKTEDDEFAEKLRKETNTEGTARAYLNSIKKYKLAGHKVNDISAIKSYLETLPSTEKERFLYSMIKANKINGNDDIIKDIQLLARYARGLVQMNRIEAMDGESKPTMTHDDLVKKVESTPIKDPTMRFIARLYLTEVPWRADTVVRMTKDPKEPMSNHIRTTKKDIVLNHYKTVGFYGKKVVPISDELTKFIRQQFRNTESKWLLPDSKDPTKPMSADVLSKIIKKIFGVGVRELRHITITEARNNMTKDDFIKLCERMNTSTECGLLVYNNTKR